MDGLVVLSCAGVDLYAIPLKACDPQIRNTSSGYMLKLRPPTIPNDTFTVDAWRVEADIIGVGKLIKLGGGVLPKPVSVMNGSMSFDEFVLTVDTR